MYGKTDFLFFDNKNIFVIKITCFISKDDYTYKQLQISSE